MGRVGLVVYIVDFTKLFDLHMAGVGLSCRFLQIDGRKAGHLTKNIVRLMRRSESLRCLPAVHLSVLSS